MWERPEFSAELSKANTEQALNGVQLALRVLNEYYTRDDVKMAWKIMNEYFDPNEEVPAVAEGAGGAVIRVLKGLESDYIQTLAEIRATEERAAVGYDADTESA